MIIKHHTSKDNGHNHRWKPGRKFTNVSRFHKHKIFKSMDTTGTTNGHNHRLDK